MKEIYYFIFIPALVIEIVAFIIYKIFYRRYTLITSTETFRISTLRKGYHEIKGKVKILKDSLQSPYSQKECVYYKFKVEVRTNSGKNSSWRTVIDDEKFMPFAVDDGSGIARIEMKGAKTFFSSDWKGRSHTFNKATPEMDAALTKYDFSSKAWLGQKSLRYSEIFLEEGDEVYVLGEVVEKKDGIPIFRSGKLPFLVSDRSEESIARQMRITSRWALFFLLAVPAAALIFFLHQEGLL